MKRYFIIGLSILIVLLVGLIFYGAWLNDQGEVRIMQRMAEQKLNLPGALAERRTVYPRIRLNDINLYSNNMADAVALIDGRITENFVPKNARVRQGETIFTIVNEDIDLQIKEADANILDAISQLKQTQNVYERQKLLYAKKATSLANLQQAETSYLAAQANMEMNQVKREQLITKQQRQEITAPIDGKILMLYRQKGAQVGAGTSLALIGDFSTLNFSVPLEDKVAQHLQVGQKVEIIFGTKEFPKIYNTDYEAGNKGGQQRFTATVDEISPALNEPATIRNVIWSIDNSSGILEPQTYNDVSFKSFLPHNCLAIPVSAIINNEKTEVYVVTSKNVVERRKIQTGIDDGTFIEVLQGLKEGEIVITHDKERLTDGIPVEVTLENHGGGRN